MSKELEALDKIVRSYNEPIDGLNGLGEVVVGNQLIESFNNELNIIKEALDKLETLRKEREEVIDIIASVLKDYKEYSPTYSEPGELTISFDGKLDNKVGTSIIEYYNSWNFWNDVVAKYEEMKKFYEEFNKKKKEE